MSGRAVNTIESCNPHPKTKYTKYFICLDSFPAYATLDKYSLCLDIFSKNVFSRILSRRTRNSKIIWLDPWMNLRVQRLRTKVTKVKFMFGRLRGESDRKGMTVLIQNRRHVLGNGGKNHLVRQIDGDPLDVPHAEFILFHWIQLDT